MNCGAIKKMSGRQISQQSNPAIDALKPRVVLDPFARSSTRPTHGATRPIRLPKRPEDIRQTKEYKIAARKWISTIVALPILFVTSYMLYERTYGNKKQRHLMKPADPQTRSANER